MSDDAPFYERPLPGPGTHAFVIGVGTYPDAKPGKGQRRDLRAVKDLPSAADGAKLVCDWLIENKDGLASPLASVELLISDPAVPENRYPWRNPGPVKEATSANVKAAGLRWLARLKEKPGATALFYACGHGAGLATQPIIFLSDLNSDPVDPWAFHNIGATAAAFRQLDDLKAAFFFADTCREFVPRLQLSDTQDLSRFIVADPFEQGRTRLPCSVPRPRHCLHMRGN